MLISKLYNEKIETACTRALYFFNTIDTYFLVAGVIAFCASFPAEVSPVSLIYSFLFSVLVARVSDFYIIFALLAAPLLALLSFVIPVAQHSAVALIFSNLIIFFFIQFAFMGLPDAIIARDIRVPFLKMFHSLYTFAPTTVSFPMSFFFSFFLSFYLATAASCHSRRDYLWLAALSLLLLTAAFISRCLRPANRFSRFYKLDTPEKPLFKRVLLLNIDGVRKDVFDSLGLPAMGRVAREGASHPRGLETVYRALTNPAFASILTGTAPYCHGVHDNNFGQYIKTEGLPDIVPAIAYGSMHVKLFCKQYWRTRIVSLPRHSAYGCDDIVMDWLKQDMLGCSEVRLFIVDLSEADFLAHAYGSTSQQYKDALRRTDKRIGSLLGWLEEKGCMRDTAVIICSDHGIAAIDHSYLSAASEVYVPFLLYGKGIKKGFKIARPGKIMDICCTISYLLGVRYPCEARGQVFSEALEGRDFAAEEEGLARRFNQLYYDTCGASYALNHPEVYEGDREFWDGVIRGHTDKAGGLRVLDIGCGCGFVAERFMFCGAEPREFVCMDISDGALCQARKRLSAYPRIRFVNRLDGIEPGFDLISASSLFHHLADPQGLASGIDRLLKNGGIIVGGHEPNRRPLKGAAFSFAASLYKRLGAGMKMSEEELAGFNLLLKQSYPLAPAVCQEEVMQMVEYHSAFEQFDRGIDRQRGFDPEDFCARYFPGYKIISLEPYTTFYRRPWASRHKRAQQLLSLLFRAAFRDGNLFRFVLQKP
jgi:SAM-dependent methyltransferase